MFMTDYEQVYGKVTGTSNNNDVIPQAREQTQTSEEKGKALETAAKAAKVVVDAHVAAAKFAGGAVSKLSKRAVEYAKSDEAAEKLDMAKDKASAAFSGLKNKVSSFAAEHKRSTDESNLTVTDEDINAAEDDAYAYYDKELSQESVVGATDDISSVKPNDNITPDNSVKSFTETENSQNYSHASSETKTVPQPTNVVSPDIKLDYSPRNYSYEEEKKFPINYVLIIVIAVLLVGVGILGGILIMKNKSADNNEIVISESFVESSIEENAESTTKEPTANTNTEKTTETKVAIKATTAPVQHIDTMEAAKRAMYSHYDEQFQMEQNDSYGFDFFDRDAQYAMYDVNSDGIDELFISYENVESTGSDLYIYKDGEYIKSHSFYSGADVCLSEHLLCEKVYGGGEMTKIYVISDNSILQKDEINELYNEEFYHNDFVISEQEYYNLMSEYDAMDWIHIPDNSDYISELIDTSAYAQPITEPYANIKQEIMNSVNNEYYMGQDSHIENAPSDMVFYESGNRHTISISNPAVYTGPGTSYSQIIVYESTFVLVGENESWYYIQWSEGAGRASHPCYGYMSKSISKYTTYDTSAAPADMYFYQGDYYDPLGRKAIGVIATETDPLNLRPMPSTEVPEIAKMPKGTQVFVLGYNDEWCYVEYYSGSETFFGYASRQYIDVDVYQIGVG